MIAALITGDDGPVLIALPAEAPDEPSLLKLVSMIALKAGPNTSVVVSTQCNFGADGKRTTSWVVVN